MVTFNFIRPCLLLASMVAAASCCAGNGKTQCPGGACAGPNPCAYAYTVSGLGDDAKLFDPANNNVDAIDIAYDQCGDGVRVSVKHVDGLKLLTPSPSEPCLCDVARESSSNISFDMQAGQTCDFTWHAEDGLPPAKFKVKIRPLSSAGS